MEAWLIDINWIAWMCYISRWYWWYRVMYIKCNGLAYVRTDTQLYEKGGVKYSWANPSASCSLSNTFITYVVACLIYTVPERIVIAWSFVFTHFFSFDLYRADRHNLVTPIRYISFSYKHSSECLIVTSQMMLSQHCDVIHRKQMSFYWSISSPCHSDANVLHGIWNNIYASAKQPRTKRFNIALVLPVLFPL